MCFLEHTHFALSSLIQYLSELQTSLDRSDESVILRITAWLDNLRSTTLIRVSRPPGRQPGPDQFRLIEGGLPRLVPNGRGARGAFEPVQMIGSERRQPEVVVVGSLVARGLRPVVAAIAEVVDAEPIALSLIH